MRIIQNTNRSANIELLRIVAMFMILGLHYYSFGVCINIPDDLSVNLLIMRFLYAVNYGCVNLFVIITGYFWSKNAHPVKKSVMLILQVCFYSYVFFAISLLLHENNSGLPALLTIFLPVTTQKFWFVSTYIGLLLFTPLLNSVITKISQKQHFTIVLAVLVLICVPSTVLPTRFTLESTGGYSLFWFFSLYFIGSYLNKYNPLKTLSKAYCLLGSIIMSAGVFLAGVIFRLLHEKFGIDDYWGVMYKYTSFPIVIGSIFLFEFFNKLQIKNRILSNIITSVSPYVLGVYLIHISAVIKTRLYSEWFSTKAFKNSPLLIVQYIVYIAAVFTACIIIDFVRAKLFNKLNTKIASKAEQYSTLGYEKICKLARCENSNSEIKK